MIAVDKEFLRDNIPNLILCSVYDSLPVATVPVNM